MNALELEICVLLHAGACDPLPESVELWASAAALSTTGGRSQAFERRSLFLERHAKLMAFATAQRALGAADAIVRAAHPDLVMPDVIWSTPGAFQIPLEPRPKGRHRSLPYLTWEDGKPVANARQYPEPDTVKDEAAVAKAARDFAPPAPHDGPVLLDIEFHMTQAESDTVWEHEAGELGAIFPLGTPDLDNMEKLVFDALSHDKRGTADDAPKVWWSNDSKVIGYARPPLKRYAIGPAKTVVAVYFLERISSAARWKEFKTERGLKPRAGKPAQRSLLEEVA